MTDVDLTWVVPKVKVLEYLGESAEPSRHESKWKRVLDNITHVLLDGHVFRAQTNCLGPVSRCHDA
jgi:hypothetical protein